MARFLRIVFSILFFVGVAGVIAAYVVVQRYGDDLPDYAQLADYDPPVTTRVHAGDGRLLAEYSSQNRLFLPIGVIPQHIVHAFLPSEYKHFYFHPPFYASFIFLALITTLFPSSSLPPPFLS